MSRFTPKVQSVILSSMNSISRPIIISFSSTPLGDRCFFSRILKSFVSSAGNLL